MTIEERAKKAVCREYNCDYPCPSFNDCIFGGGSNNAYDCEECGADEYRNGYIAGATEQKKIDHEDWKKDMRFVNDRRKKLIDKACEWLEGANKGIELLESVGLHGRVIDVEKFRKEMEEN